MVNPTEKPKQSASVHSDWGFLLAGIPDFNLCSDQGRSPQGNTRGVVI